MVPCTGFPLNFRTPPLLGASRHTVHHSRTQVLTQHSVPGFHRPPSWGSGPPGFALLFASRASPDGRCSRFWCLFFGRGLASASPPTGTAASESVDGPAGVTPGKDGGIGSHPLPSPGGWVRSPWSTSRARTRGLSIVPGSPPPSAGSSPGSGRRGSPCRRSRWSGCHCDWPSPGEPARPDPTLKGRVSSSLASSDN